MDKKFTGHKTMKTKKVFIFNRFCPYRPISTMDGTGKICPEKTTAHPFLNTGEKDL